MDRQFVQVKKVLARNVRSRRKALELSQESLALEADVDRTSIGHIERSAYNPSLLMLHKIARALGTDVQGLVAVDK